MSRSGGALCRLTNRSNCARVAQRSAKARVGFEWLCRAISAAPPSQFRMTVWAMACPAPLGVEATARHAQAATENADRKPTIHRHDSRARPGCDGRRHPGADVSVINVGTNEVRHVTTDRDGAYVVPQLKPGIY